MKLAFLDTETTGLDQAKGHQIIEVCIASIEPGSGYMVDFYEQRIEPTRPIDPDAQAVHGIAMTDLTGCPSWESVAGTVGGILQQADLIVAHNLAFDLPFINAELGRIGRVPITKPGYCTMENGRWACFDGKQPRLEELCFALGIPYDPALAHSARYDVERLMECYFTGVERGFFK